MKKIGILTYSESDNYGAVLQAYALEKFMIDLFIDDKIEIIRYFPPFMEKRYNIFRYGFSTVRNCLKSLYYAQYNFPKKIKFKKFRKKYLISSKDYYKFIKPEDKYDFYIVGSDQVWNLELNHEDTTFLLDFVSDRNKKISYAASIATENYIQYDRIFRIYLPQFRYISIREKDHLPYVEALNSGVILSMDSVFLLTKEQWKTLIKPYRFKFKYIFIYTFKKLNDEFMRQIDEYALRQNYRIISIGHFKELKSKVIRRQEAGPLDFLRYIYYAEFIITDSFHGTAFACIFNKNFYCIEYPKTSSRMRNLLAYFEMKERIFNKHSKMCRFEPIDYSNKEAIYLSIIDDAKKYFNMIGELYEQQ